MPWTLCLRSQQKCQFKWSNSFYRKSSRRQLLISASTTKPSVRKGPRRTALLFSKKLWRLIGALTWTKRKALESSSVKLSKKSMIKLFNCRGFRPRDKPLLLRRRRSLFKSKRTRKLRHRSWGWKTRCTAGSLTKWNWSELWTRLFRSLTSKNPKLSTALSNNDLRSSNRTVSSNPSKTKSPSASQRASHSTDELRAISGKLNRNHHLQSLQRGREDDLN